MQQKKCNLPTCSRPAEAGRTRCKTCRAIANRCQKERSIRLKAEGLCVACGRKPPKCGSSRCQDCTDKYYGPSRRRTKALPGEQFTEADRASWWFSFEFPELVSNADKLPFVKVPENADSRG